MTYWQLAAGDGPVDISPVFFRHGVALVAPGNPNEPVACCGLDPETDNSVPTIQIWVESLQVSFVIIVKSSRIVEYCRETYIEDIWPSDLAGILENWLIQLYEGGFRNEIFLGDNQSVNLESGSD